MMMDRDIVAVSPALSRLEAGWMLDGYSVPVSNKGTGFQQPLVHTLACRCVLPEYFRDILLHVLRFRWF